MPRGKLDFYSIYKWAGVLHQPIGKMSFYEFLAASRGYAEANGGAKPKGRSISEERLAEMGIVGFD